MTTIRINNARFFAYHGVHQYEKDFGNEFQLDVEMHCNIPSLAGVDDLSLTVDYQSVYNHISEIILNNKFNLLETLNQVIGNSILENFELVESVKLSIRKSNAPIGLIDSVEIISDYKRT